MPDTVTWIIETPRLRLREMKAGDGALLCRLNADPDVVRFTGDGPFESKEAAEAFVCNYSDYRRNGFGRWLMFTKDANTFVGWCGLKKIDDRIDLGYRLLKEHWNKGFASEAAKACLDHGFNALNLERIVGRVAPENKASVRVLEKLGMTFWKTEACDHSPDASIYVIEKRI